MTIPQQLQWCNKSQKFLAIGLVSAIVIFYFVFYHPAHKRLSTLNLEAAHTSLNIQSNHAAANDLHTLEATVQRLQTELATSRNLPDTADVPVFMRSMTELSQRTNLSSFKWMPQSAKPQAMCREMPISLQFSGNFDDVAGFLLQAEEMPRLMRLRRLQVKRKDDQNGVVDVELVLNIYYADTK